jgi:hypothetical protein
MVTYTKRLQTIFHEYQKATGKPGALREVILWAVENGKMELPEVDPVAVAVSDMKHALRAETRTDAEGREYRANASVTFTDSGGIQTSLWGDVDQNATPDDFLIEHFGQRRKGVLDDCAKLKADVDHHNAKPERVKRFQLILDFTEDVAERETMRESPDDDEPRPDAN